LIATVSNAPSTEARASTPLRFRTIGLEAAAFGTALGVMLQSAVVIADVGRQLETSMHLLRLAGFWLVGIGLLAGLSQLPDHGFGLAARGGLAVAVGALILWHAVRLRHVIVALPKSVAALTPRPAHRTAGAPPADAHWQEAGRCQAEPRRPSPPGLGSSRCPPAPPKGARFDPAHHPTSAPTNGPGITRIMVMIVNLGCGNKTHPDCLNIDWSIYARIKRNPVGQRIAPIIFNGARLAQFQSLADNVLVHDLRKGIPLDDASADLVYHSHVLEHVDRHMVEGFLTEIHRVLRPGGVHRVVVPDLERYAREYLASLDASLSDSQARREHDSHVSRMLAQMVRREAHGTSLQGPVRRRVENLVLGDARRRGETHMWMWDRVNITQALEDAGFQRVRIVDWQTSRFSGWNALALDQDGEGTEYKPESLYVEAVRS
jgi:SAM-dependent methyltransferase